MQTKDLYTDTSYAIIAVVQVGVPHKAAESGLGWAWAGSDKDDDAIAANRLSHMVSTALADKVDSHNFHLPAKTIYVRPSSLPHSFICTLPAG